MAQSRLAHFDSLPKREAGFIEPMDCALVSDLPEGEDWIYEVKLDGYRAIGAKTGREAIIYSRNGKNFNKRYPYLAEAVGDLQADTVIDGEIVALDDSSRRDFHRLQHFGPRPHAFTTLFSIFSSRMGAIRRSCR